MSGRQWVRLDAAFPRNHKILALLAGREGHRTAFVYCCGLAFAGEHGTNGFIPREALPFIHARKIDAQRLTDVQLWVEEQGGWLVNDWSDYQPSTEEQERRSLRARSAANVRWSARGPKQGQKGA